MPSDSSLILIVAGVHSVPDEVLAPLAEEGWPLQRCSYGREAMQLAVVGNIGLVIADVDLPDMDGYELQAAYADAFPHRQTPFLLLAERNAPQEVIPALADDAIGFLLRPVSAALIRHTLVRLAEGGVDAVCEAAGELAGKPLTEVLEFCQQGSLTGELEVQTDELEAYLDFQGGELLRDGYDLSDEDLHELAELESGMFAIRARVAGADEEQVVTSVDPDVELLDSQPPPSSKLTAVAVGDHLVNVETEYEPGEAEQVTTVVSVDGKERKRTTSIPPPMTDPGELEHYVADQHAAVEAGVLGKVEALLAKKHQRPEPTHRDLDRYVWLLRHCCAKEDYAGAQEVLSGALALFPDHPTLHGYRQLARRKLSQP